MPPEQTENNLERLSAELKLLKDQNKNLAKTIQHYKMDIGNNKKEIFDLKRSQYKANKKLSFCEDELIKANNVINTLEDKINGSYANVLKISQELFSCLALLSRFPVSKSELVERKVQNNSVSAENVNGQKSTGAQTRHRVGPMVEGLPISKPTIKLQKLSICSHSLQIRSQNERSGRIDRSTLPVVDSINRVTNSSSPVESNTQPVVDFEHRTVGSTSTDWATQPADDSEHTSTDSTVPDRNLQPVVSLEHITTNSLHPVERNTLPVVDLEHPNTNSPALHRNLQPVVSLEHLETDSLHPVHTEHTSTDSSHPVVDRNTQPVVDSEHPMRDSSSPVINTALPNTGPSTSVYHPGNPSAGSETDTTDSKKYLTALKENLTLTLGFLSEVSKNLVIGKETIRQYFSTSRYDQNNVCEASQHVGPMIEGHNIVTNPTVVMFRVDNAPVVYNDGEDFDNSESDDSIVELPMPQPLSFIKEDEEGEESESGVEVFSNGESSNLSFGNITTRRKRFSLNSHIRSALGSERSMVQSSEGDRQEAGPSNSVDEENSENIETLPNSKVYQSLKGVRRKKESTKRGKSDANTSLEAGPSSRVDGENSTNEVVINSSQLSTHQSPMAVGRKMKLTRKEKTDATARDEADPNSTVDDKNSTNEEVVNNSQLSTHQSPMAVRRKNKSVKTDKRSREEVGPNSTVDDENSTNEEVVNNSQVSTHQSLMAVRRKNKSTKKVKTDKRSSQDSASNNVEEKPKERSSNNKRKTGRKASMKTSITDDQMAGPSNEANTTELNQKSTDGTEKCYSLRRRAENLSFKEPQCNKKLRRT